MKRLAGAAVLRVTRPYHVRFKAAVGAGLVGVALWRNRWWGTPNLAAFSQFAKEFTHRPLKGNGGDYILTSPLGPGLARMLGQIEPHEFARLHLLVLICGCAVVLRAASKRLGQAEVVSLGVLIALSPGLTTTMQWLGQPDAFTFPLGILLVLLRRRWAMGLAAILLGLAHPEQGVMIAAMAVAARWALQEPAGAQTQALAQRRALALAHCRAQAQAQAQNQAQNQAGRSWSPRVLIQTTWAQDGLVLGGGVLIGRILTQVWLELSGAVIGNPRPSLLNLNLDTFLTHHATGGGWLLYCLWGPLWAVMIAVACSWRAMASSQRRIALVVASGAVLAILPVVITLDETRVYAMITAPLLVPLSKMAAACRPPRWAVAALIGCALLVPGTFTAGRAALGWELEFNDFAVFLMNGHHEGELTTWLLSPFNFVIPGT